VDDHARQIEIIDIVDDHSRVAIAPRAVEITTCEGGLGGFRQRGCWPVLFPQWPKVVVVFCGRPASVLERRMRSLLELVGANPKPRGAVRARRRVRRLHDHPRSFAPSRAIQLGVLDARHPPSSRSTCSGGGPPSVLAIRRHGVDDRPPRRLASCPSVPE
jgi:hypothetical protein